MTMEQIACDMREGTFPKKSEQTLREEAQAWQPIATAPKDGTRILAYCARGSDLEPVYSVTWWRKPEDGRGYVGWGEFNSQYWPPTHWMPIPAAPR